MIDSYIRFMVQLVQALGVTIMVMLFFVFILAGLGTLLTEPIKEIKGRSRGVK